MALCQFGNCKVDGELPVKVSIGNGAERLRFCSAVHAAAWLLRAAARAEDINLKLSAMASYEVLKPQLERDGGL